MKQYESYIREEKAYQENIFFKWPKLRELIHEYDKSTARLAEEEAKLKEMVREEYQTLNSTERASVRLANIESIKDMNMKLKG